MGQGAEQLIFRTAQLDGAALKQYQVLGVVNGEVSSCKNGMVCREVFWRRLAAQKSAYPCQQFFHTKGFQYKIVGTKVKQAHTFVFVAGITEHDHRSLRKLTQPL